MSNPASQPKLKSSAGFWQGALVFLLMLLGAASGGYFVGTQMQFRQLQAGQSEGSLSNLFASFGLGPQMKKVYWIHSRGYERAGYTIGVSINGQPVGKFYKPETDVDVTRYIHPGRNTIVFEAKSMPLDQRTDNSAANFTLELRSAERTDKENQLRGGDVLLDYTRQVTDTEDFKDQREFEPIE
ncbi:MAG TPA: hypothetical protein V6D08_12615 [Candidatus Obscuribacterales bacterium]